MTSRRSTVIVSLGAAVGTAMITFFLAREGLERASWWAAIAGSIIAASAVGRDVLLTRESKQADLPAISKPAARTDRSAASGSVTVASEVNGDNIQIGDNNTNVSINRGQVNS